MVLPLGRVMVSGLLAGQMLVAGAFSTKKWPFAPESDNACLTDLVTRFTSKIVAVGGIAWRLFAWTIVFQAAERVGIFTCVGWMMCFVGGKYSDSSSESSSLVMSSVAWVHLSCISLLLLMQTVSSSEMSASARVDLLLGVGYSGG